MSQHGIWSDALENWMSFDDRGKLFVASLPIARAQLHCVAEDMGERLRLRVLPFDTEPVTVYSIWNCTENRWVVMVSDVFHTIYRAVAEAQLDYLNRYFDDDFCVRELPLSGEDNS